MSSPSQYQGAQYQGAHPSDQQRGQLSHMDVATLAKMAASVGLSAQDIYKAATGASAQETEVGSLSGAPSAQENDVLSTMGSLGQHDTQTPFGTFAAGAAGETSPLDLSPLGHSLAGVLS